MSADTCRIRSLAEFARIDISLVKMRVCADWKSTVAIRALSLIDICATPVNGVRAASRVVSLVHSTTVGHSGTDGLFTKSVTALKVVGEQFWGRAARASNGSKEVGTPVNFCG